MPNGMIHRGIECTIFRLKTTQKELLKKANNKEAYDEIADQIFKLREQREKCTVYTTTRDTKIARINKTTVSSVMEEKY